METDDQKRKEKHLEEIRATMTERELEQVKQAREFADVSPGTRAYRIAIFNDVINREVLKCKSVIEKSLINIEDLRNQKVRLQLQLTTGNITHELKPGVPMTADEVKQQVNYVNWLIQAETYSLPFTLLDLRRVVGHKNVALKVVMTEDEFEKFAEEVEARLVALGQKVVY